MNMTLNVHRIKAIRATIPRVLDAVTCGETKVSIVSIEAEDGNLELNLYSNDLKALVPEYPTPAPAPKPLFKKNLRATKSSTFNNVDLVVCGVELTVDFDYQPGTPDVLYLPNGDPGHPGDPEEVVINDISIAGSEDLCDYFSESFRAAVTEKAREYAAMHYDDMGQEEYDAERKAERRDFEEDR